MKQNTFFLIVCLSLALISSVPQEIWGQGSPKRGGTINVGLNTDIVGVDPHGQAAVVTAIVLHHIFESLVGYGEDMRIMPVVAERWESSEDLKTYTFYLIKGKTFHNGREVTAEDVKYSLERLMDPKTKATLMTAFKDVEKIEVKDKYTVTVHLNKPNAWFLHVLAHPAQIAAIIPREEIEKQGGVIRTPIGTGPFKFVEWKPDRYVLLERYDKYLGQKGPRNGMGGERIAYVEKVKFVPLPEESVSIMALLNKEVDVLQYFPIPLVDKYKSEYSKKGIVLQSELGLSWYQIFLGVRSPVTSNLKFRQACAYAIDQELVTKAAYGEHAKVNPSIIPTQSIYYTPYHKTWYKKDVAKARELLKEAGYKGEEVVMDTTKKYIAMYRQGVAVQSELAAVGINIKLNVVEWPVLLQKNVNRDFQMLSYGTGPIPNLSEAYTHLKRSRLEEVYPRVDELLEQVLRTSDFGTQRKIFEELHKIQVEWVPMIMLYNYYHIHAHHDYVKGYKVINTGFPRLWGVWLDK